MDYEEALAWLYGRQALGIKLGLQKVEALLDAIGAPHHRFRSVHVAGTNGKGSVVVMLDHILRAAGFVVGRTTSPHLVSFRERIVVDGEPVPADELAQAVERILPAVADLDLAGQKPTFFECVTAIAFDIFARRGVQWAVVETGMGGRLDATNVLHPALTVITSIGLDHLAHLGSTIPEITWEKAGIMKPGIPCVTAASGDALVGIKARSQSLHVPMSVVGEDYRIEPEADGMTLLRPNGVSRYQVGLAGRHQLENAALAVAACDALARSGVFVPERAVQQGLRDAVHAGRLDMRVVAGCQVLLDGAHNPPAAQALAKHLQRIGWTDVDAVVGFCADKQWQECVDALTPHVARWWPTPLRNPRTLDHAALAEAFPGASVMPDAGSAIDAACASGARRIVVTGSLYLVGEALARIEGRSVEEVRGNQ